MQQQKNDELFQWNPIFQIKEEDQHEKVSGEQGFISTDYFILTACDEVYVFDLKKLSWSKHDLTYQNERQFLGYNAIVARPGLIVGIKIPLMRTQRDTVQLLRFNTEGDPQNFVQTSQYLTDPEYELVERIIGMDGTFVYTLGYPQSIPGVLTLYQINPENGETHQLEMNGTRPCNRRDYQGTFYNGKIYLCGGKDETGARLCDLWVFSLGEMKWERLQDIDIRFMGGVENYHTKTLMCLDDNLVLCGTQKNQPTAILTFNLRLKSWRNLNTATNTPQSRFSTIICPYKNSLILYNNFNVYSLTVSNQQKKSKGEQLQGLMDQLFKQKTFADVIFKVENQEFPANKCVLSLRCPLFKQAFSSDMMESKNKVIPINNVRAKVFHALLQYIYYTDVELESDIAEDLLRFANECRLEKLKNDCEKVLVKDLTVENVIHNLQLTKTYEANILRKECLVFIHKNLEQFFRTQNYQQLDPETFIELCKFHPLNMVKKKINKQGFAPY